MDNYTRKLLGLTDIAFQPDENWLETSQYHNQPCHIIKGSWTVKQTHCPHCKQETLIKHASYTTKTRLPKFRECITILKLKRTRYYCKSCRKTCSSPCSLVNKYCSISKELEHQILLDLKQAVSRQFISKNRDVSDVVVRGVMKRTRKDFKQTFKHLPKVLCMDEFKSTNKNMSFILVDGISKRVLDVLESRKLYHLIKYFLKFSRQQRLQVQYLVMDMNASYPQLIKLVFPNATIVTDRFHIVQHINRSFNQLRISEMKHFNTKSPEYRHLKRFWKLLLKDPFELDCTQYRYNRSFKTEITQSDIVDRLLSYSPVLKEAYEFLAHLKYAYRHRDFNLFMSYIQDIPTSLPDPFIRKFNVFLKYSQGIENAFQLPYSNGITEGIITKIKLINRIAYGHRSFQNLRCRIFMAQSYYLSLR